MKKLLLGMGVALSALLMPLHFATASEVPAEFQAIIFSKVMKFDRSFPSKVQGTFTMGYVYRDDVEGSKAHRKEIMDPMAAKLASDDIQGAKVAVVEVALTKGADVAGAIGGKGINGLYLAQDLDDSFGPVIEYAKANKLITYTEQRDYFTKGVAVGIKLESGKPKIVISQKASQEVGADFDPRLLKLAELVD